MTTAKDKKRPTGKLVRLVPDLRKRITEECEYLGVAQNAWISMTLDRELRRAQIERVIKYDPKIKSKINAQLDCE